MNRLNSIRSGLSIKFVAVQLICAAVLLSSFSAAAEDPIPFKAMMQSAGAQAAVPPKPQASNQVRSGPVTSAGKAEIVSGFVLLAAGVATISITAALRSSGFSPSSTKTPGLYVAGAGAAAGGVTLVALGFHRRKAR